MDEKLSIGAVSRLTGVTQHTLRKWESRHGIGIPERSETGRRVYRRETVDQLKAVRGLLDQGHSLIHLTGKTLDQLLEMLGDLKSAEKGQLDFDKMVAVAEMGVLELRKVFGPRGKILEASLATLRVVQASNFDGGKLLTLIEQSSMTVEEADDVARLTGSGWQVMVCVQYLSKKTQNVLKESGVQIVKWPLSRESLGVGLAKKDLFSSELMVRERVFSHKVLKKLASTQPSLDCECPNHIAKLLIDITAFESYCMSCEDSDPVQRKLHGDLATLTAMARMKLEEGLLEISKVDDIVLSAT